MYMYNINYDNVKSGKNIYILFFIIGFIVLIVFGFIIVSNSLKKASLDSVVEAKLIVPNCHYNSEGTEMCSPIYYYEVEGIEYQCITNGSSSTSVDNNKNKVYYNSNKPNSCLNEYDESSFSFVYVILLLLSIGFILVGGFNIRKINKKIKKMKYLEQHGTLFKGLQYRLERTGIVVNNRDILAPVIDFILPNSSSPITLKGDARFDGILSDNDGLVDLLIDINDTDNYYIDFNIDYK